MRTLHSTEVLYRSDEWVTPENEVVMDVDLYVQRLAVQALGLLLTVEAKRWRLNTEQSDLRVCRLDV